MHKILLPRLGQTMEEGLIAKWLVGDGESVTPGQALYEVETEKVTAEVEANLPGRLVRRLVAEETTVPVGTLVAVVADPGEQPDDAAIDAFVASPELRVEVAAAAPQAAAPVAEPSAPAAGGADAVTGPGASPSASGPSARTGIVRAMPRTRRLARDEGIDLASVVGTGPEGLVTEQDVRDAAAAARPGLAPAAPVAATAPTEPASRVPLPVGVPQRERRRLGSVARTMAQVTSRSWAQVPAFSQTVDIVATGWKAARDRLREETGRKVGYTDMVIEAVVRAVAEVPEVNSSYDGDALVIWDEVNLSIAVDTDSGLLVPVLHGADSLDVAGRVDAMQAIVERARGGRLGADDVSGGTLTVSNLGMFGIDRGVPLVTAPQAAIVFVGAMTDRVVAVRDAIAIAPVFSVTTAFDHRCLDGATAARFTSALRRELEAWA
ncbi:2-oxo acid dehydrogenase subunit E2 [Protaetiibacter sp. SSC-01]|uniref:dihydrolipoamide acetyltransferase family protein n=1 Tax=Protaetiibacter sp. SSC-01 TaxID=2759943 RepID=UPI00165757B5|nr:dihydrolipoamide acetyltransferase family protein [Protaetiibacter sp. SSC-01]QNO38326.1 2-oxo acid dehydrogenase subunit E2 [Protaetiibacter sp. SSC-01]